MIPPALHKNMTAFEKAWKSVRADVGKLSDEELAKRIAEAAEIDRGWLVFTPEQRAEAMDFYYKNGIPPLVKREEAYVPEVWPEFAF